MYTLKSWIAFTKANPYFSIIFYSSVASIKDLLKNTIGCSYPWLFFCSKTIVMVCSKAKEKITKSLLKSGLIRTGAFVKPSLMASKDCLASIFYLSVESILSMLFNSLISSARFEMDLLIKFVLPRNDCNSLMFLGWVMVKIASVLAGSILIPSLDMICPNNFPSSRPNIVFLGFKEIPNFLHLINTLPGCSRCSLSYLEKTALSSL